MIWRLFYTKAHQMLDSTTNSLHFGEVSEMKYASLTLPRGRRTGSRAATAALGTRELSGQTLARQDEQGANEK
eukprot:6172599-Pleurochrysis_carterae.AAC.2